MKKLKNEVLVEATDENGEPKTYKLRYDLNALADFEDLYDKSILEIFSPSINAEGKFVLDEAGMPVNVSFRIGMLRDLIWVGLKARQPELTRKNVGAMFDLSDTDAIMPHITEALAMSNRQRVPKEDIVEEGKDRPKK
jgi:hypothetical protein